MNEMMMEIISNVLDALAIIVGFVTIFIVNMLERKREKAMLRKELKDKQLLDDWSNCSEIVKIIANDFSFFMEKTRLIVSDKELVVKSSTTYKIEILKMQHDLNEKLLKFHELIERIEFSNNSDYNIFQDFYSYTFNEVNNRYKQVMICIDKIVSKENDIIDIKEFSGDSKLLGLAIKTATENYRTQLNKND
ncbi:hypothetical protein [Amedibacterium intestinale]|uniref:Uncharacterized protein n=1 Tax=Amedibacterium intestinale TaxID=2583452 RepID=A0A6N4TFP9_9FIRM|nr:hypothetical protein [Amedibacterium intestinale]RHO23037.1 hypothetical protein DW220_03395 [Eubacterium sp. AM18-26]RHO23320.1 hypothetical protein DW212_10670 [Eubacterium sp. AM18-10LB-B]BBK21264.1 hypothetical protein Aargi30884_01670 [Amedibacterium intestinale]